MIEFERKTIVAGNLVEFCQQAEEMLNNGWRFNFIENELVPIQSGILYYCTLEKPITPKSNMGEFTITATGTMQETEDKTEDVADALTEDIVEAGQDQQTETVRRGRKPKAQ